MLNGPPASKESASTTAAPNYFRSLQQLFGARLGNLGASTSSEARFRYVFGGTPTAAVLLQTVFHRPDLLVSTSGNSSSTDYRLARQTLFMTGYYPEWSVGTSHLHLTGFAEWTRRIDELAALAPNWDSWGAVPPTPAATQLAKELLRVIEEELEPFAGDSLAPDSIGPIADGGVGLDWDGPVGQELNLEIAPSGKFAYLYTDRSGPQPRVEARQHATFQDVVRQIVRTAATRRSGATSVL